MFFFLDFAYVGIFRFSQNFDLETATNEIIIMIFVTIAPQAKILMVLCHLLEIFLGFTSFLSRFSCVFKKSPHKFEKSPDKFSSGCRICGDF